MVTIQKIKLVFFIKCLKVSDTKRGNRHGLNVYKTYGFNVSTNVFSIKKKKHQSISMLATNHNSIHEQSSFLGR